MEETIQDLGFAGSGGMGRARRALCLFAALALVIGGVALLQSSDVAGASPASVSVAAGGGSAALGAGLAQIDVGALIRAIVCPILDRLAAGPFGPLILPIINALRARFGCISPG